MSVRTICWRCYHCGELYKTKTLADRHELTCKQNPVHVNCLDCRLNFEGTCKVDGEQVKRLKAIGCEHYERTDWKSV